jgi:potassium-transporting ATPase KdpC subunit
MFVQLRSVVLMFIVLTLITGVAYPLLVTVIAQTVFPYQANGSLIVRDGKVVGSELIGQSFDDPKYFWGRPSATSAFPNDASASSGSNLGPTNPSQFDAVRARLDAIKKAQPDSTGPVPIDLVTASASGLDPQISPAAAEYQVARVAQLRNVAIDQVRKLVTQNTESRTFGILGEPRVNVLKLNLALDDLNSTK